MLSLLFLTIVWKCEAVELSKAMDMVEHCVSSR